MFMITGAGCALTGQQADVIVTHFFREKLTMAQRLISVAPSIGNCIIPLFIGFLCSTYTSDVVVMIYAAILMQNCLFLASFTRPIYIEKVLRSTYKMLRDAVDDEDEVIFSNQRANNSNREAKITTESAPQGSTSTNVNVHADDVDDSIVVFNSRKNAKEILDPSMQMRENGILNMYDAKRFSSDFNTIYNDDEIIDENRFSTDYGKFDVHRTNHKVHAYQELENIDSITQNPQPLYRETTVHTQATQNTVSFAVDPNAVSGPARRTASLKKNFITIATMLRDINFYLYTILHMSTTFSVLILGVIFPPLILEHNSTLNIWKVSVLIGMAHAGAFCFVLLCTILPKAVYEKYRLCAMFCMTGAMGFFGKPIYKCTFILYLYSVSGSYNASAHYT